MKKIFITGFILTIATVPSGCFGIFGGASQDSTATNTGKLFENQEISLRYASNWNKVTEFGGNFPTNTIVAFQNLTPSKDIYANLNLTKEKSLDNKSSLEFAENVLSLHQKTLNYFKEIGRENITLNVAGVKEKTLLVTFDAKADATNTPILRFQQTYLIKGESAYILTGTYSPDEDDSVVKKITLMLKSLAAK